MLVEEEGGLHSERPHHLVVLVVQEVTVIDIPWELDELVLGDIEEGIGLHCRVVLSARPANSQMYELVGR